MLRFLTAFLFLLLGTLAPASAQQWAEYRPQGAGFRIEFPAAPDIESEDIPSSVGPLRMTSAEFLVPDEALFMVADTAYPASVVGSDPEAVLDGALEGFLEKAKANLREEIRLTIDGKPARRVTVEAPKGDLLGTGLLVLSGDHLYIVMALVPNGQENSEKVQLFLKSFALLPR